MWLFLWLINAVQSVGLHVNAINQCLRDSESQRDDFDSAASFIANKKN